MNRMLQDTEYEPPPTPVISSYKHKKFQRNRSSSSSNASASGLSGGGQDRGPIQHQDSESGASDCQSNAEDSCMPEQSRRRGSSSSSSPPASAASLTSAASLLASKPSTSAHYKPPQFTSPVPLELKTDIKREQDSSRINDQLSLSLLSSRPSLTHSKDSLFKQFHTRNSADFRLHSPSPHFPAAAAAAAAAVPAPPSHPSPLVVLPRPPPLPPHGPHIFSHHFPYHHSAFDSIRFLQQQWPGTTLERVDHPMVNNVPHNLAAAAVAAAASSSSVPSAMSLSRNSPSPSLSSRSSMDGSFNGNGGSGSNNGGSPGAPCTTRKRKGKQEVIPDWVKVDNIEDFKRLCEINCKSEEEVKDMTEQRRKIKNRDAAQRSRQKRILHTQELTEENTRLNLEYSERHEELRQVKKRNNELREGIRRKIQERDMYIAAKRARHCQQ